MEPPSSPPLAATEPALPTIAGTKRSAPSLLPPFEPLSSSPGLPRPTKRQNTSIDYTKYPTPVPTSSTGILSSSPPRVERAARPRPSLQWLASTISVTERVPLLDLRSVELKRNGEPLIMGRSSESSHYQLSTNRLISRIHVRARHIPAPDSSTPNKVEIICCGWNGLQLRCQGNMWELAKGDTFVSEMEGAELMVDVQDTRVLLRWPSRAKDLASVGDGWDSESSVGGDNGDGNVNGEDETSPLLRDRRLMSPVSPSPAHASLPGGGLGLKDPMPSSHDQSEPVKIYEDPADQSDPPQFASSADAGLTFQLESFSSDLSEPDSGGDGNPDEENDPIVHSFGPFGANFSRRLEPCGTVSPRGLLDVSRDIAKTATAASSRPNANTSGSSNGPDVQNDAGSPNTPAVEASSDLDPEQKSTITNHVVNQLAYSRLASNPLSGMMNNLPADAKSGLTKDGLRYLLEATACIGVITRQGKDAAGKPLESEYYYIPEHDEDEHRRLAVTDGLGKPSLRNCRKKHKQYYWKRPRTP